MAIDKLWVRVRGVGFYLWSHPFVVIRLCLAGVFAFGLENLINGVLTSPESIIGLSHDNGVPSEFFVALYFTTLVSIGFWHLLLWPLVISKKLFVIFEPKPMLCIIDYIWYVGGLITLILAVSMAAANNLRSIGMELEDRATQIFAQSEDLMDAKADNCEVLEKYLLSDRPPLNESGGLLGVLDICRTDLKSLTVFERVNYCIGNPATGERTVLRSKRTQNIILPYYFDYAIENIAAICDFTVKARETSFDAGERLKSSEQVFGEIERPDLRYYLYPLIFIGLRLVKTTSELFASSADMEKFREYDVGEWLRHTMVFSMLKNVAMWFRRMK